ncbi:hypothetical protein SAMN05443287_10915 [Micromonospora phaseoli]|uniref:Uncharacterized protein n=1 Tax=Micromonospora phaseoli TaxID=1144548 RepID=A0A1H7C9Y2_9ACTN|nr:hypothetical protein [Micromonospora phaseoli]PZV97971.1 hypothetical protein CLV64_105239 [Micromonospora phaseoli]GIJ81209.1 hypothetical protein Xph01_56410 [Micromonospora phaseoli]SEJ86579.1 hypothetical protein SAMN05443287_10915 [Micromonospora phaseoli]
MSVGTPTVRAGRSWRWWDALRLGLVALWLAAAGTAWWTAPRTQSYDQARADLAAGRVVAYQWGDHWDADRRPPWFDTSDLQSSGTLGPLFGWRTTDGRVWWTDTEHFGEVTTTGAVDESSYTGPGAVGLAQHLRAADLEDRSGSLQPLGPVVSGTGLAAAVIILGVVVGGPAPVLGTRWFWFWLVCLVPLGLGLLWWLAREHPWSRAASPPATPAGPRAPDRGPLGFALGLLATLLISLLVLALGQILGDQWVPRMDAG